MATEPVEVHGIPVHFAEVDDPDRKYGGVDKSFNELKEGWLDWLRESEAVKKKAPLIKRLEIGSLAHFYFKDSKVEFHCKKYDTTTTLEKCEWCTDWNQEDMECSAEAIGDEAEKPEKYSQMLLDTMHVLRVYMKPRT